MSVRGEGQPLLLVMGIGGSIEMWEPLVARLRRFTTIAFDAPGTGESETPAWPLRMPQLARVCAGVLDALDMREVDVLGVSFGGAVAQEFTHRHPERVRRLVLAATMPGVGGVPGRLDALALLSTPYRYYSRDHFRSIAARLYGGELARHPELLDKEAYTRIGHAPSVKGYLWQLAAITGWSSLPYLRSIRQPALVMTGDDDPIIRVMNGRILAWALPNARLHVVRGGGHLFLIDQAAESARVISDFLASD